MANSLNMGMLSTDGESTFQLDEIPGCWSLESSVGNLAQSQNTWDSYWEGLSGHQQFFREQAKGYLRNLEAEFRLEAHTKVLDFGCGFGFVAEGLAARVGEVYLWDTSANMRRQSRLRLAGQPNIRFLDLSDPNAVLPNVQFDLILVNSVVQYMTLEEFSASLGRWVKMLAPQGCIVVSDLIAADYPAALDILHVIRFVGRSRCFFAAMSQALSDHRRYWKSRRARPLTRIGREEVSWRGWEAGLQVSFLPKNLTHLRKRVTAIFTHAQESSGLESKQISC